MGFVNPRNVGNARDMRKGSEKKKVDSCNRIMFALYNALWWILVLHSIGNFKCIILYLWNGLGIYVTLCFCFAKAKWNIISTSSTNIVKYGLLVYPNVENRSKTIGLRGFLPLFTETTYVSSSGWFSMSSRFGISNISTLSEKDTLGVLLPDDTTE